MPKILLWREPNVEDDDIGELFGGNRHSGCNRSNGELDYSESEKVGQPKKEKGKNRLQASKVK